jgi:hypothetical protein
MNRLPDGEVHVYDPPSLERVGRARDGDIKAVTPPSCRDEANVPQELLQVDNEAWSIDEDVQSRSGAPELPQRSRLLSLSRRNGARQGRGRERQDRRKARHDRAPLPRGRGRPLLRGEAASMNSCRSSLPDVGPAARSPATVGARPSREGGRRPRAGRADVAPCLDLSHSFRSRG